LAGVALEEHLLLYADILRRMINSVVASVGRWRSAFIFPNADRTLEILS